ncbi:MAG: GNAT family N-acetyltransferase [Planctomycetota bacterium]
MSAAPVLVLVLVIVDGVALGLATESTTFRSWLLDPPVGREPGTVVPTPPETERLRFRCWTPADLELARELWGDPRVTRLIDARPRLDEDEVRRRLDLELAREASHGIQYWPLFLREGGDFVGCCGLRPADPGVLELGFHLRPDHWGQGLAGEAAQAVVAHAFDVLGVEALCAGHHPENAASARLLEKLGFRRIGESLFPATGRIHPAYLLRADEAELRS